jgi:hypothetical protein
MTLKELEAWHRRGAEGLLRSAQSEDRRGAYDVLATKGVPKKAETERGGILQLRIFWRQSEGNDHVNRRVEKLIARFDPALSLMRAAELCAANRGAQVSPGRLCEQPEDLLPWARSWFKGRCYNGEGRGLGPLILAHGSSDRSRLDHLGAYG